MTKTATAANSSAASARSGRMTPNDRVVLACLQQMKTPMKAYDLLEALRHEGINAPMTVYRALGRLCDRGRVRKIESTNAYYAIPEDEQGGIGAFLLCGECGNVGFKHLAKEAVDSLVPDVEVRDATIELTVSCQGCDQAPTALNGALAHG